MSYLKLPFFLKEKPLSSLLFFYQKEELKNPSTAYFQNTATLKLCKKGKGQIKIDHQSYEVCQNTLLLIPPCSDVRWVRVEEKLEIESFSFNFFFFYYIFRTYSSTPWSEAQIINYIKKNAALSVSKLDFPYLLSLFKTIEKEVQREEEKNPKTKTDFSGLFILTILIQLMVYFYREQMKGRKRKANENEIGKNQKEENRISDGQDCLISYLLTNLNQAETKKEVAKKLYKNEKSLDEELKNSCGYTYQEICAIMRFKRAYMLLLYSDATLEEIAQNIGFSDRSNFIHSFQKIIGQGPDSFRKDPKNQHYQDIHFWSHSELFTEILSYYSKHAFELGFRPSQAESELHLPGKRIKACLKTYVGLNPNEYIDYLRIIEACRLLNENQKESIDNISWSLGFQSAKSFYRVFKKWRKKTPGEYRKDHRTKYHQMSFRDLGIKL